MFVRVLKARLVVFLESHGVITLTQYGFRSDYSTSMVILEMVKVRAAWGHGNVALGIFIDTVDYGVLLARMEHYRVRGRVWGCWPATWEGGPSMCIALLV